MIKPIEENQALVEKLSEQNGVIITPQTRVNANFIWLIHLSNLNRLMAIKFFRSITNYGLRESIKFIDSIMAILSIIDIEIASNMLSLYFTDDDMPLVKAYLTEMKTKFRNKVKV
jgi:hypothetical protein